MSYDLFLNYQNLLYFDLTFLLILESKFSSHDINNKKKELLNEERVTEIERENRILYEKVTHTQSKSIANNI